MLHTEHRAAPGVASEARTPRLVVPPGLIVDDVTRDRLDRHLARAPQTVGGIAAEVAPLSAGSSYRVHAEWKALEPFDATNTGSHAVRGAVLLRAGIDWTVRGDVVDVHDASLIVDAGAHVHDPHTPIDKLASADPHGRSPFPRRPIVAFLATTIDDHLADWSRRVVNRLMPRDIEARLLLPVAPRGLHLTRPATPTEESVRALAPDAVVALDADAVARAHEWCDDNRSTVVLAVDRTQPAAFELVSWQIGHASGRLRARIGPLIDAPALASLIRRLCSGPHPAPPRGEASRSTSFVALRRTSRETPARTCAIVTGDIDGVARRRGEAMCDHMQAAGIAATTFPADQELPESIAESALVIVSGSGLDARVTSLIAARREHARPTVLDLQSRDVVAGPNDKPVLTDDAATRAEACGLVTSFGGALHRAATAQGLRALTVPTMLTRRQAAELRAARSLFDPNEVVVGWTVGSLNEESVSSREALSVALAKVLTEHPELRVDAQCEPSELPSKSPVQVRAVGRDERAAADIGGWWLHLFTPASVDGSTVDDVLPFTDAGQAGAPTIMPSYARSEVDGYVPTALVVQDPDDPEQWSTALLTALESEQRRGHMSVETRQRADAVNAAATAKAMMNRLVGWARFGADA